MLRSSSTPILGSLTSSSFPETSPNLNNHEITLTPNKHPPIPPSRLSFHQSPAHQQFNTFSCNSSPMSPSMGANKNRGFRRAQSEGNLQSLLSQGNASANDDYEDFGFSKPSNKKLTSRQHHTSLLETIPSFSFHKTGKRYEDECDSDEDEEDEEEVGFHRYGNTVIAIDDQIGEATGQMYMAKGLGIDTDFGTGSGGGKRSSKAAFRQGSGGGNDNSATEEHYKKMVHENPGNSLFLRNYAQFLYQSKNDLKGAEEYYSRAILADPQDGEILSQYAKLIWDLHRDKDRVTNYFERAIHAASENSHVHAAYANFLWETEEEEDEDEDQAPNNSYIMLSHFHKGAMASARA